MKKKKLSSAGFGEKVREYRTQAELRVEDLATKAGLNPNYLARLERGEVKNPTWSTVVAICAALGLTPNDFAL